MTLTVSGVVNDLDKPTDFGGRQFISVATIEASTLKDNFMMDVWDAWTAHSELFVKLSANQPADAVQTQLNTFYRQHNAERGKRSEARRGGTRGGGACRARG